jgi:hypothetical protein
MATALRCILLCCAVLCCAVLCCAVLCCAVLCCAVLCCAVLCCAAKHALVVVFAVRSHIDLASVTVWYYALPKVGQAKQLTPPPHGARVTDSPSPNTSSATSMLLRESSSVS